MTILEIILQGIPAILIALGTFYAGVKALKAITIEGDKAQAEAWIDIRDSYKDRLDTMEVQSEQDRKRIQQLEAAEQAGLRQLRQAEGRILDLEREKGLSAERQRQTDVRLGALEAEHHRVLESLKLYKNGIKILLAQLKKLNIDPEWTLPEEKI